MRPGSKIVASAVAFVVSLLAISVLISKGSSYYVVPFAVNWVSLVVLIEGLDSLWFGRGFLQRSWKDSALIFAGSIVFCSILAFFLGFAARLWYYPKLSLTLYLILAPIGYYLYTKAMFLLYESFEQGFRPTKFRSPWLHYDTVMGVELLLAVFGTGVVGVKTYELLMMQRPGFWTISTVADFAVDWWYPFAVLMVTTWIFEYVAYRQGKSTLTEHVLCGDSKPLISILIANLFAVVAFEYVNVPFGVWEFVHWPLQEWRILDIPVLAYVAWPFQFPAFLAILRSLLPVDREVW